LILCRQAKKRIYPTGAWKDAWTQLWQFHIAMIENGVSKVPIKMIPQLSNLLDLDPKKLLREVMICRYPTVAKYM
jgi:hypothetical protein